MQTSDRRFQQNGFINKKVANQEQAIGSQIRRFKQNYLNKVIQSNNLQTFIRFSKQVHLLLISHCKNIVCIAPEKVSNNLDEISIIFDDIINKYHQVSLKINDRSAQIYKNDNKTNLNSELCSVCSQQIKKVHIDQMRKSILNETHNIQRDNQQPKNEEQDLQFFADLNDLLNHSYGQLIKNQIEIDMYQDVALNALKSLSSLKTYFSRDSVIIPNNNWIEEAREEMQAMLKQNFNGKIPPWIEKMFSLFWTFHRKQALSKQRQVGVQTLNNSNTEILQLKKKIYRSNEKLEKTEAKVQNQEHQISTMNFQKKDLEIRVNYYKKELNKLIDQIQAIKSENQAIKMKLSTNFDPRQSQSITKTQLSYIERDNILIESSRSKKRTFDRENSLPKIMKSQDQKRSRSKKRDSQTSIKMYPLGPSQYKTERDTAQKKLSGLSSQQLLNKQNEQTHRTQPNSPSLIRRYHNENLKDNVIQQQEGQAMLQEQKKKITQVSDHIKYMVKSKIGKNGFKHYFSNSVNSDKIKDSLKRIPRRTNKQQNTIIDVVKIAQKQSIYKNIDDKTIKAEKFNNTLIKIYHYLRNQGMLIKMSQQQFKQSITKIDLTDMNSHSSEDCQKTLQARLSSHNNGYQRCSFNRKSWNEQTFHIDKENNEESEKLQKSLVSKYFSVFSNQQNAYNYELSLTKNHYKGVYKMTKLQEKICEQFYQILMKIKTNDFQHYKFICSYLRYPYQVIKNDFGVVNMVNQMKFENFHQYFQRLLGIHVKCKKQQGLCEHFIELKDNLMKNLENKSISDQ